MTPARMIIIVALAAVAFGGAFALGKAGADTKSGSTASGVTKFAISSSAPEAAKLSSASPLPGLKAGPKPKKRTPKKSSGGSGSNPPPPPPPASGGNPAPVPPPPPSGGSNPAPPPPPPPPPPSGGEEIIG